MCAGSASWGSRSNAAASRRKPMLKWALVLAIGVVVIALLTPWLARRGLGRLPGDITVRWRGRLLYLPITSTLLVSALLTLVARAL